MTKVHEVVIIGGGFAGLSAAKMLAGAPVRVTLIDRRNHHLFQPLLYQVATGGLSPADISSPIRALLRKQKNAHVLMGNVRQIDAQKRQVLMADESAIAYDTLVVATGANHAYFVNDHWSVDAPGLKTLKDATAIRHKILMAFERAEKCDDAAERAALLTFVIAGAGPTGVELAGALAELAHHTLPEDFRSIKTGDAKILLVDGGKRVLGAFGQDSSLDATLALEKLGVTVETGSLVTDISPDGVTLKRDGESRFVATKTVLWAAGVRASLLGKSLARATGVEIDRVGRVRVNDDFSIPQFPEIFVIGDLAARFLPDGTLLPGTAAVAQQEGKWVGKHIRAKLSGKKQKPFRYTHYGDLAVIGRSAAVVEMKRLKLKGNPAWWFWLLVHLMKLVDQQNRLLVLVQWAWSYFTRKRSARLINTDVNTFFAEPDSGKPPQTGDQNAQGTATKGNQKGKEKLRLIA